MTTYDMTQTAELLEELRGTRLRAGSARRHVRAAPRRDRRAALAQCRSDRRADAIVESAEQTAAGVRYKEPKSGRGRTVALSAMVDRELRQHRLAQAEELLRLGIRQSDATFV